MRKLPALDIYVESDVPIGVGLSSSAALEVATLRALRELFDLPLDDVVLAQLAQRAEIDYAGVSCGILDQMASSLLTPGTMLFLDTRSLERKLLPLPGGAEILVIDSGIQRHESLRDDYAVSVPALDRLAALLQTDDAVFGAKLTGAGFGGARVALCRAGSAVDCAGGCSKSTLPRAPAVAGSFPRK